MRKTLAKIGTLLWLLSSGLLSTNSFAQTAIDPSTLAPGYGPLSYPLPAIGSYELPPIKPAPNGTVITGSGQSVDLHDIFSDNYVLLSFFYSNCADVNGCPLASHVFYQIKTAMQTDPALAKHLTLASISFDPSRDTPEIINLYANNFRFAGDAGRWEFLTTASDQQLAPLLKSYGQDVQPSVLANGKADYSHLLRVFLIDPQNRVRNIYSVSFLHSNLLINDVKTLMAEANITAAAPASAKFATATAPLNHPSQTGPGDSKQGYTEKTYRTDSRSLVHRRAHSANLLDNATRPTAGLPALPVADLQRLTSNKISLGRKLFYDRRLSINDTFSCAMCHIPDQGFTSNEMATAVGVEGRSVRRNTPSLLNIAYITRLFLDGREENLEQQIWGPLLAKNEMANPSVGFVLQKIRAMADYDGLFEQSFDGQRVNMQNLGEALASYQRSLLSGGSAFDHWHYGNDKTASPASTMAANLDDTHPGKPQPLSTSAQRGFALFTGRGLCVSCHSIGNTDALFTDNKLHNTGIGYAQSHDIALRPAAITIAPGVVIKIDPAVAKSVGETPPTDIGLYEITENPADRWKFRTPSLRNIALTAPYMHNGVLGSLREVVEYYNRGGVPHDLQDPRITELNLNDHDIDDLVNFMLSLTGDNIETLVADGFAAPVGDPRNAQ